MNFTTLYIEAIKKNKEKMIEQFIYLIGNLGINYNHKIKELSQCLKIIEVKLIEAEKYWYNKNEKFNIKFITLLEGLDSLIKFLGWRYDKEVVKGFNLTFLSFYNTLQFNDKYNKDYEYIEKNYRYLKALIGYYKNYCLDAAITLNMDSALESINEYIEIYFEELLNKIKPIENPYQKYVGINLKKFKTAN